MSNKDLYNKKRRLRYKEDEDYRQEILDRMKERGERLKEARHKRRLAFVKSCVQRWEAEGHGGDEIAKRIKYLGPRPMFPIVKKFGERKARLIPISVLGAEIGFSPAAVRKWEDQGVIPPAVYRDKSNRRYYSEPYLEILKHAVEATRRSGGWKVPTFKREVEKRWQKRVKKLYGSERRMLAGKRKVSPP